MTLIKDALVEANPWWKAEVGLNFQEREIYLEVQKFIPLRQVIAFTGLRRVGKTTLMLKIVQDALASGFDAKNVVYFSFDEFKETELRAVLREYEGIMEKNLGDGKYLVLFDEIQKLPGWEDQLKSIYDVHRNLKFVVSGSESLFIRRESRETLTGRMFEFEVKPLSFREFLAFKGIVAKPAGLYEGELRKLFGEYTLMQGLPELVDIKEEAVIRKYVKEGVVEKIVYRDLPKLFEIRDSSLLESLLNLIAEEPGQLIELNELASELGVSRNTLSNYLYYLEKSFLVKKLYNYSRNKRKVERKLKKYYPTIASPNLVFKQDDNSKSRAFEWLVVRELGAEFFWRDPYKNEVDAVLANVKPLPIEVKYGKIETKGLQQFMKKFGCSKGIIVTTDTRRTLKADGKTIQVMPAYKLLIEKEKYVR